MANNNSYITLITILSLFTVAAAARFITTTSPSVSDGVNDGDQGILLLKPFYTSSPQECEQTYGFMPCTTTAFGNLFLIIVYGYFMYLAATHLSAGSELLLQILGPGLVGGLCLPALGALPDAMLILGKQLYLHFHHQ
ncbi:putative calcium/proton exchanger [Helianthus annuus]|nr:putative calcium/proton exchanger [Helianthus annuus]